MLKYAVLIDSLISFLNADTALMRSVYSILLCLCFCLSSAQAQELEPEPLSLWLQQDSVGYKEYISVFKKASSLVYRTPTEALLEMNHALELARSFEDTVLMASSYNRMAIIMKQTGDYTNAQQIYFKALRLYEQAQYELGIVSVYNNIARLYHDQVHDEQAMRYYSKAIRLLSSLAPNPIMRSAIYHNIGEVHNALGEYDEAYLFLNKALDFRRRTDDVVGEIDILANIAHVYSEKGEFEKAEATYRQAMQRQQNMPLRYGAADTYIQFGKFYVKRKNYNKARPLIQKGLEMSQQMHEKEAILDAYEALSKLEEGQGNYQASLAAYKKYNTLRDSLFSMQRSMIIADTRIKYSAEKKDRENQQLREDKKRREDMLQLRNVQAIAVSVALVAVFFLTITLYIGNQQKKKANNTLQEQNVLLDQKREEIASQKEDIERKNEALEQVNYTLEEKNKRITDSLVYGQSVQTAIFPTPDQLRRHFQEAIVLFRPKDFVSGDFYWTAKVKDQVFFAVADCTGHGVPGAFMSLLGHAFLHEIILAKKIRHTDLILNTLHDTIVASLHQKDGLNHDGMTITLMSLEERPDGKSLLSFSGAKMDLWIYRQKEGVWEQLHGDRKGIGGVQRKEQLTKVFSRQEVIIEKGDLLYSFSDGYPDQSNPKHRRFGTKKLMKLIQGNVSLPFDKQYEALEQALYKHQAGADQRDDITVVGLKL